MNLMVLLTMLCAWTSQLALAAEDPAHEALRICGIIHQKDIHTFHRPHAAYSNDHCFLQCYDGDKTLSLNAINEGFHCPANPGAGTCHHGVCVGSTADALSQCAKLHNTNFGHNNSGTGFVHDHCSLRCVLGGLVLSTNHLNENQVCETHLNGICRHGECVSEETTLPTKPTTKPAITTVPTTQQPTPPALNTYKIESIQALIKSATLEQSVLNHKSFGASVWLQLKDHWVSVGRSNSVPKTNGRVVWHHKTSAYIDPEPIQNHACILHIILLYDGATSSVDSHAENLYKFFERNLLAKLSNSSSLNGELAFDISIPIDYRAHKKSSVVAHVEMTFWIKYSLIK